MTAYSDANKIAIYLGVTLTAPQIVQAGLAAQAASDWIDVFKARSWQDASPVTDESHDILGDRVYLTSRPVVAVTSVKTKTYWFNPAVVTTLDASQYTLADAGKGLLIIQGWAVAGVTALVSYTHATQPPAPIAFAATMIAASLLGPTIRPNTSGLESVAVGQNDVAVKFSVDYGSVPNEALSLLGARGVVVA